MNQCVLKLNNLTYSYDGVLALDGVNLNFTPGEKVALLGENGAGKSTLMLCCGGVLIAKGITLNEQIVTHKKADLMGLRRAVGLVFQDSDSQIIAPTVIAEVAFGLSNIGFNKEEATQKAIEALAQMGLENIAQSPPQYLSGGQKKRVCIASILAMGPQIIMMDEPTAGLDAPGKTLLMQSLKLLEEKGYTVVISTHDSEFALKWANRAVALKNGKMVADCDIQDFFKDDNLVKISGVDMPAVCIIAKSLKGYAGKMPRDAQQLKAIMEENK